MSYRRGAEGGAPWWWSGGGGRSSYHNGGGFMYGGRMAGSQYPATGLPAHAGYQLPQLPVAQHTAAAVPPCHQQGGGGHYFGRQNFQMPLLKPRLRWTKELHDQFVSAVNQLGGAYKATPKTIWNIMRVEGVTLFHIKSHLQKYRLGKVARKFVRSDELPADVRRNIEDELQNKPMDMEGYRGSSNISYMHRDETLRASIYGNLNNPVEFRPRVKNSEMTVNPPALTAVKLEKDIGGTENPPPFQPIPTFGNHGDSHYYPDWYESLPHMNSSLDDYLNSLGNSSELNSSRSNMMYGSFFDEVERFSKIEDELMRDDDDDDLAMDAPAQLNNNVSLYRGV